MISVIKVVRVHLVHHTWWLQVGYGSNLHKSKHRVLQLW